MSLSTSIYDNKIFSSSFSVNLQAVIDNSQDDLYGQTQWRQFMDWGVPQTSLTFEWLIGRKKLKAAASLVDIDAPAPKRSRDKVEKFMGKIPTMKESIDLDQQDYRTIVDLMERNIRNDEKKAALMKYLFDDVSTVVTSIDRRIDIMFFQMMTSFTVDLSVLNNPDGTAFGTVALPVAASQTNTVAKVWTDNTSDPLADIERVITTAANSYGRRFKEIWIDNAKWLQIKNYAAVKAALSGYNNPGSNAKFLTTLNSVNEYLGANSLPPLRVWNVMYNIEKDGLDQFINPFNANNIVLVPEGQLGTVENAWSIEAREPVPFKTYANYDKVLLSKYRQTDPWRESTQAEVNAMPVIDALDGIWLIKTDTIS
jgi:hypothetical protein